MNPKEETKSWIRDITEILITLAVILLIFKLFLGAQMPVPLVAVVSCSMLHEDDAIGSVSYALSQITYPLLLDSMCSYESSRYWKDWIRKKIPGQKINGFSLKSGFAVGDMILVITPDGKGTVLPVFHETRVGDVIIFNRDKKTGGNEPIIHRVVGIVRVDDWRIIGTDGTLDCNTMQDFKNRFIPYVKVCQQGLAECQYRDFPIGGKFEFYITKGDNNPGTDQCKAGILPVTNAQVTARGWLRLPYLGWVKLLLNRIIGLLLFFL